MRARRSNPARKRSRRACSSSPRRSASSARRSSSRGSGPVSPPERALRSTTTPPEPRPEQDRDERGARHDERAEDHPERGPAAGGALGQPRDRPVDHAADPAKQPPEGAWRRRLAEAPLGEDGGGLGSRRGRRRTDCARRRRKGGEAAFQLAAACARERRAEIDGGAVDAVDLPQLLERRGVARGTARELAHLRGSRARGGRGRRADQRSRGQAGREPLHSVSCWCSCWSASASRWLRGFHPGGGGQYGGWSSGSSSSRRGASVQARAAGETPSPGSTPICSASSCRSNASLRTRRSK